eukprot:scaffold25506_cov59-Phaeocystis_antarctica.AAC.2
MRSYLLATGARGCWFERPTKRGQTARAVDGGRAAGASAPGSMCVCASALRRCVAGVRGIWSRVRSCARNGRNAQV